MTPFTGCSPYLSKLPLRDCSSLPPSCCSSGNHHYLPNWFSEIASVTPPHCSSGSHPLIPQNCPSGIASLTPCPTSLLLRESLPFPCSSEMAPEGMCLHLPQGSSPHPQNCPSRIAPLAAPLHVAPQGNAPLSSKLSLRFGPSSSSGITPSWTIPLLPLRDHPLIPKTVPQGLTLTSSRVAPFVPQTAPQG